MQKFVFTTLVVLSLANPVYANVVGTGSQNFNTTTDGLDYVTVQSSKTLTPGVVNLGFFVNDAINTLPYLDSSTQSRVKLNDNVFGADFNAGIGIMNRWDAGISVPFILGQTVTDQGDVHGQFGSYGNTEIRLNTKYRVLGEDDGGIAAVASVNFNRTQNDPYSGIDSGPTYNFEFVADKTIHQTTLALNFGRRFRDAGTQVPGTLIEPLTDQWIFSGGASYLLTSLDTKLIAEIFASMPVSDNNANLNRSLTSAEGLIGVKHDVNTNLAIHGGGGTTLSPGVASPDWRVYAGLNYTFGPLWAKKVTLKESVAAPLEAVEPEVKTDTNEAPKEERFRATNLLFGFNSDKMKPEDATDLTNLINHLKNTPFEKLVIEGYTDSMGNYAYNISLSLRRAKNVRDYLVKTGGIPASKIEVQGYGPERPIADNGNFQGRSANRRVEFQVVH